jgi:Flp pilus assembly protein TadD
VRGALLVLRVIAAVQLITNQAALAQDVSIKTLDSSQQARPQASVAARDSSEFTNSEPVLAQAKLLADKGAATEAEQSIRHYLAAHPNSANGHFLLGYILFREVQEQAVMNESASGGQFTSTAVAGSASSNARGNPDLADNTPAAVASERKAKVAASLVEFTEGAKYHTPSAYDLKIVALDYILLDDYMDADKWLTKMLQWTPNDSEGWYYLGRTKYNENRFDEAVRAFQQTLKLDPNNVKAEDNLGLAFAGLGRIDDATGAYQDAIALQKDTRSKNAGPFIDMADLLLNQNRSAEAVPYLKQAIEISPGDFKAHELLGKAYSRLDQFSQAQTELEQASALAPQNPNLPCMLAPLYRRQGQVEKAKAQLDRCSALNGTHSSPEIPRP